MQVETNHFTGVLYPALLANSVPPTESEKASLEAELTQLNSDLKELHSTDHSLRAYVAVWIGILTSSVSSKLTIDYMKSKTVVETPLSLYFAGFLAVLFVIAVVYYIIQKTKQQTLWAEEKKKLMRQRALRCILSHNQADIQETISTHAQTH